MGRRSRMSAFWGAIISITQVLGCANSSQEMAGSESAWSRADRDQCVTSGNLLQDTNFPTDGSSKWAASVHGGTPSFSVTVEQGVLQLERTGPEPWMTYQQWADIEGIERGKLILSAELKGDLQAEPRLHAFKHVAGLWLQPGGPVRSALVAEHEPNDGVWDWQTISMEADLVPGSKTAVAGFIHQTGGTFWVRNPSLIWTDC